MSALTSNFVYISRKRTDIIQYAKQVDIMSLPLIDQDAPTRPRKYPSYLVTRFHANIDPLLAKEIPGVHSDRRFYQKGCLSTPLSSHGPPWSHFRQPSFSAFHPFSPHRMFDCGKKIFQPVSSAGGPAIFPVIAKQKRNMHGVVAVMTHGLVGTVMSLHVVLPQCPPRPPLPRTSVVHAVGSQA